MTSIRRPGTKGGQPTHVWTPQRRRNQSRTIKQAWSKKTPKDRVLHSARTTLQNTPISDDDYEDCFGMLMAQTFLDDLDRLTDLPAHSFAKLCERACIDGDLVKPFRARLLVKHLT